MPRARAHDSYTGYLSPQSMAFLLAAQVTVRGMTIAEGRRVGRLLETNQQAFFNAARRHFEDDVDGLRIHLGIPPREVWPKPQELAHTSLPDDARFDPKDGTSARRPSPRNAGANIFRVRASRRVVWMGWGAALGGVAAIVASRWMAADVTAVGAAGLAAGAIVAAVLGWGTHRDTCSDPQCDVVLFAGAETCHRCAGRIRGIIADANGRLEAEEALEDSPGEPYRTSAPRSE